jgi:polar amino acid transport system permease protein
VGLVVGLFLVLLRFRLDVAFMAQWFWFLLYGVSTTIGVSLASIGVAIVLALFGALGRISKNAIAYGLSTFYISFIRGTPLLVQVFIVYLGLPQLGIVLDAIPAGIIALSVNYGAYMTEIFRAGIQSISHGQTEAAYALGMTYGQTFRRIIFPQAIRVIIPPVANEFMAMLKDSALVSMMGVWELTFRAQKVGRAYFKNLEMLLIAAALYWLMTIIFSALQARLEGRLSRAYER